MSPLRLTKHRLEYFMWPILAAHTCARFITIPGDAFAQLGSSRSLFPSSYQPCGSWNAHIYHSCQLHGKTEMRCNHVCPCVMGMAYTTLYMAGDCMTHRMEYVLPFCNASFVAPFDDDKKRMMCRMNWTRIVLCAFSPDMSLSSYILYIYVIYGMCMLSRMAHGNRRWHTVLCTTLHTAHIDHPYFIQFANLVFN